MKKLRFPARGVEARLTQFMRGAQSSNAVSEAVTAIRLRIQQDGMAAVIQLTEEIEHVRLTPATVRVSQREMDAALNGITTNVRRAIQESIKSVTAFHRAGLPKNWSGRNSHGATVGEVHHPLREVGLYIPGGRAPLVSTVIMTASLAKLAKVERVVACTPPGGNGSVNPAILAALKLCGVSEVYRLGGAIAVSVLAYGAGSIRPVDKIFGPGNAYVTEAKRQVFGDVGIDLLAGPSEVMIIADESTDPAFVAADLIAQAEHGPCSKVVFTAPNDDYVMAVERAVEAQAKRLQSRANVDAVLSSGALAIVVPNMEAAAEAANVIAPEHLEILLPSGAANRISKKVTTAGAVFLGPYTPTAVGDFVAGPNHTLPTGRAARYLSGLRITDFFRRTSTVSYDRKSLERALGSVQTFAEVEQLEGHGRSVEVRFQS